MWSNLYEIYSGSRIQVEKTFDSIEEVDGRVYTHHALSQNKIYIHIVSNDTDVIIIALGAYHLLCSRFIFDDISIKLLAEKLGYVKSQALVFLHAIKGCNTVSSLRI